MILRNSLCKLVSIFVFSFGESNISLLTWYRIDQIAFRDEFSCQKITIFPRNRIEWRGTRVFRGLCVAQAAENVVSIVENCPILGQAACIYKARDFNRGRIGLRSKTDNQKRREGLDSIFFNCLNAPFLTPSLDTSSNRKENN